MDLSLRRDTMKKLAIALALAFTAAAAHADGAAVFQSKCAMCHGKDGKGSPAGLKMGAHDLNGIKLSEADIEKVVADGKPGTKMVGFKSKLSEAEIKDVSKFVKSGLK
jgi:cytochrome c6